MGPAMGQRAQIYWENLGVRSSVKATSTNKPSAPHEPLPSSFNCRGVAVDRGVAGNGGQVHDRRLVRRDLRVRGRDDADGGAQRGHGHLVVLLRVRATHLSLRQRLGEGEIDCVLQVENLQGWGKDISKAGR